VATRGRRQVAARIIVVAPPEGVLFALQRGRKELGPVARAAGGDLAFPFPLGVDRARDGSLRLSGEFIQGPAGGKFVYVNSGTLAGQAESPWTRRAKVGLRDLSWTVVDRALSTDGAVLQARIEGRGRDGGPACASVPLLDNAWTVEIGRS